jgi:RecB family endonuclease NucS
MIDDNPEIVEPGFEVEEFERWTDYGCADIVGKDRNEETVIVEVKSHRADIKDLKQLVGFVGAQEADIDGPVRGVLVAPTFNESVSELTNDQISIREVDLTSYKYIETNI